ncbi:PAS domain-containing sensor histidine kinase [Leptospira ilyithenensis]|uniref:histidine kinase n=1 Tax=Leptospira ilyithenensis TaxID=2484901 RepID=A0A4R9LUR9_9LEPT|nr:PAS domain-containing sensor histidine kinase [Leptospira ilyithenensis]TGN14665.1 PAS domain-containing sensor histidine kinase [Leptospira ilyithenensis]
MNFLPFAYISFFFFLVSIYYFVKFRKEKKLRILLFEKNIDKSTEIERVLIEKEKQYQDIYETANSIIIRWNPNFIVHSINPYAEEFFGIKRYLIEGKDLVIDLFNIQPENVNVMKSQLWNIFHLPEQFIRQEYDVFLPNEDRRTISWSNRILKDAYGYPFQVLSIGNDITNRKLAEENLLKSYERILDLYNNAPCGYHSQDSEGMIVSINDTELAWLGYSREEMIGKMKFESILTDKSKSRYYAIYEDFKRDGSVQDVEYEYIRKDGSIFIVSLNSTASYDKDRNFTISRATIFDITERKRAEQKLNEYSQMIEHQNLELQKAVEEANLATKSKSIFFSKITHELRTPLHAVIGFSQILEKDPNLPTHLKGYVHSLYENGVHLLGMINDILDLSKIEAGKMTESKETFSLVQLWDNLFSMFAYRFLEKGLSFYLEDPKTILGKYYDGDIRKIRQILVNFLGNSLKFTEAGEIKLNISIQEGKDSQTSDLVLFSVTDTGIGIPENQLDIIFEAFQQTEQGSSYKEGTGLGLAISHQLVEFLGGTIGVRSEQNKGSIFSFKIPLRRIRINEDSELPSKMIGPTNSNDLKPIKQEEPNENKMILDYIKSLPEDRQKEILHLIRIQDYAKLILILKDDLSNWKGKDILIEKAKERKFKFLIDFIQSLG